MFDNPAQILKKMKPEKEFFIGIDSDGCVFDTMEIKQKECFCPNFIKHMKLQAVSKYARETWEFVNLYSKTRGCNRFLAVKHAVNFLKNRPEVKNRGVELPDLSPLEGWIEKESKLGNPALEKYLVNNNSQFLETLLKWSLAVNGAIKEMVSGLKPFPPMIPACKKMIKKADMIVISQTPVEALQREWEENSINHFVKLIAGQEFGKKTEHLALAAKGKYPDENILMIGDAPGDLKAARDNNALFYPINPGDEERSWERLNNLALDKFFSNNYKGDYEDSLIDEFNRHLPETPPWKKEN